MLIQGRVSVLHPALTRKAREDLGRSQRRKKLIIGNMMVPMIGAATDYGPHSSCGRWKGYCDQNSVDEEE
jgi:hypothetical protein